MFAWLQEVLKNSKINSLPLIFFLFLIKNFQRPHVEFSLSILYAIQDMTDLHNLLSFVVLSNNCYFHLLLLPLICRSWIIMSLRSFLSFDALIVTCSFMIRISLLWYLFPHLFAQTCQLCSLLLSSASFAFNVGNHDSPQHPVFCHSWHYLLLYDFSLW